MSFSWQTLDDGYRAQIKLDLPAGAIVYTCNSTMVQLNPLPPLKRGVQNFGDFSSANVIVVGHDEKYILAGAVTAFRSLTMLRAVFEQRRLSAVEVWQPEIRKGEKPEEMVILEGSDWRKLLCDYADIAAKKMGVPAINSQKNVTGYCSWYYYYKDVTQANMLENVDALAANRSPYVTEYVQIDDGYQTFQGDWLDQCDSWPTPVKEVAEKITASGMKAGIWTMPTSASTASRVHREHPDWFVKDENGETAVLPGWSPAPDNLWGCLDATNPEVREHIANVFKTFRSWGFTYFKLDGLYFGLQQGRRCDPDATTVSAFRLLLKTIREAVPDALIMGCSEPFLPCLGLIDNARVSNDTSRYYSAHGTGGAIQMGCSILDAFRISLSNFFTFDRWFRADPDVIMARQDNAFYSRNEAKLSVLAAIMTGVAFTSDHLGTINPDRNAMLAKAQNIRMRDVMPLRTVPNFWPREFEGTVDGKRAVALVNDTEKTLTWKMADIGMEERCFDLLDERKFFHEVTLDPHDAVLLIAGENKTIKL
ncbi:MAG: alpha-galactosidase [Lentisphaeria bacterium]|nr:alpha-galactosidase [Lentisphaeria bacterium]